VEEYIVENDTPDVTPLTTAAVGHLYLDHLEYGSRTQRQHS
jgi:hypothetical protein